MLNYYLGLDNGGTTTKAALYLADGTEVCTAATETKMIIPRPGFIERDMEEMWQANCFVIRQVLEKSGVPAASIRSIAVCGHGKGLYLWGQDGKPARNGIISTDNRAARYPEKWKKDGTWQKIFALTCQHILACQPVSLLAWLKDNEPATLEQVKWVFECKDYIRFRLTGEARAEITDYSGANLLNLHTRDYDPRIFELLGLTDMQAALPPLCTSTEICGTITEDTARLTGLAAGTPVAGGMFDIDACALAVNVVDDSHACMIAGTWSINEYLRRTPVTDGSVLMNSLFCLPEYYLIEECSPTSAGNNEWFIKNLLSEYTQAKKAAGENVYAELNDRVAAIPPNEFCPVFLPFLMASNVNPDAKACFVGLSNYHTRDHMLRSVYEGIAFSHRYHFEKLKATRDVPFKSIRLAGGVAHSGIWTQMFADVLQLPVETMKVNETGAFGCAIAAAVAVGDFSSLAQAADSMCTRSETFQPNPDNFAIYDRKYELYLQVIQALDPVWSTVQAMIDTQNRS